MAHGGHVGGPREPTWMPAWCLHGVNSNGLANDGPTGWWAQVLGRTWPNRATHPLRKLFLLYSPLSTSLLRVGLCSLYFLSLPDAWRRRVHRMQSR